jgi:hypothetical protein
MTWTQFSHGRQLDPIAGGSPEALVALLHNLGAGARRPAALLATAPE